jgi:hypothetical protein
MLDGSDGLLKSRSCNRYIETGALHRALNLEAGAAIDGRAGRAGSGGTGWVCSYRSICLIYIPAARLWSATGRMLVLVTGFPPVTGPQLNIKL